MANKGGDVHSNRDKQSTIRNDPGIGRPHSSTQSEKSVPPPSSPGSALQPLPEWAPSLWQMLAEIFVTAARAHMWNPSRKMVAISGALSFFTKHALRCIIAHHTCYIRTQRMMRAARNAKNRLTAILSFSSLDFRTRNLKVCTCAGVERTTSVALAWWAGRWRTDWFGIKLWPSAFVAHRRARAMPRPRTSFRDD